MCLCSRSNALSEIDPRGHAGAVAIATATAFCLRHKSFLAENLLNEVIQNCEPISSEFAGAVRKLGSSWIHLPMKQACSEIMRIDREYDDGTKEGISGFVTTSVVFSLLVFLRNRNSLPDCLAGSIGAGGDTDSTAAMTCCLCGAFLGLDRLREQLPAAVAVVNDKGTWGATELEELALKVYEIASTLNS